MFVVILFVKEVASCGYLIAEWNLALIYVVVAFKSVIIVCGHVNEAVENLVVARHAAVLFITLFNVILTLKSLNGNLVSCQIICH